MNLTIVGKLDVKAEEIFFQILVDDHVDILSDVIGVNNGKLFRDYDLGNSFHFKSVLRDDWFIINNSSRESYGREEPFGIVTLFAIGIFVKITLFNKNFDGTFQNFGSNINRWAENLVVFNGSYY